MGSRKKRRRHPYLTLDRSQQILEARLLAYEVQFNREYEKRFKDPKDGLAVR